MSNFTLGRRGSLHRAAPDTVIPASPQVAVSPSLPDSNSRPGSRASLSSQQQLQQQQQQQQLQPGCAGEDALARQIRQSAAILENANFSVLVTPMAINTLLPFAPFYSYRRSQPFVPKQAWKSAVHGIKALRRLRLLQPGGSLSNAMSKLKSSSAARQAETPPTTSSDQQQQNRRPSSTGSTGGPRLQADMIVVSGHEDGHILVWNAEQSQSLNHAQQYNHVTISQCIVCNTVIYTTAERHPSQGKLGDDDSVTVWDLNTMKVLHTLSAHEDRVTALAVSEHDESKCFSGGVDHTIFAWDIKKPTAPVGKFVGHASSITQLICVNDALISASSDGQLRMWHTLTFAPVAPPGAAHTTGAVVDAHNGHIERCMWLVTPSEAEREAIEFERKQRHQAEERRNLRRHPPTHADEVMLHRQQQLLGGHHHSPAVGFGGGLDDTNPNLSASLVSPSRTSRAGQLVTACSGGQVRCWACDLNNGFSMLWSVKTHRGLITDVAVDRTNKIVAATSAAEGVVSLYHIETQSLLKVPVVLHGGIRRVSLDPSRLLFLVGADSGSVCVWSYAGFAREPSSKSIDAASAAAAGGAGGGGSLTTAVPIGTMHPHLGSINSMLLEVTTNGAWERLITCAKDNSVFILDFDTSRGSHVLEIESATPFSVNSPFLQQQQQHTPRKSLTLAAGLDHQSNISSNNMDAISGLVSRQGLVVVHGFSSSSPSLENDEGGCGLYEEDDDADVDGNELTPAEEFYRRIQREEKLKQQQQQQQQQQKQNQQTSNTPGTRRQDMTSAASNNTSAPTPATAFIASGQDVKVFDTIQMREKTCPPKSFSGHSSNINCIHRMVLSAANAAASAPTPLIGTGSEEGLVIVYRPNKPHQQSSSHHNHHNNNNNNNNNNKQTTTPTTFEEPMYELDFSQPTAGPVRCLASFHKQRQPGVRVPDYVSHLLAVGSQRKQHGGRRRSVAGGSVNGSWMSNDDLAKDGTDAGGDFTLEKEGSIQLIDVRTGQFANHPITLPAFPEKMDVFFSPSPAELASMKKNKQGEDDGNKNKKDNNKDDAKSSTKQRQELGVTITTTVVTGSGVSDLPQGTLFVICHLRNGAVYSVEFDLPTLIKQQAMLAAQHSAAADGSSPDQGGLMNLDASVGTLVGTISDLTFMTRPYALRQLVQASPPKFYVSPLSSSTTSSGARGGGGAGGPGGGGGEHIMSEDHLHAVNDYAERHPASPQFPSRCKAHVSINLGFLEQPRFTIHFVDRYRFLASQEVQLSNSGHNALHPPGAAGAAASTASASPIPGGDGGAATVVETVHVTANGIIDLDKDILDLCLVQAGGVAFAAALSDGSVALLKWSAPNAATIQGIDGENFTGLKVGYWVRKYGSVDEVHDDSDGGRGGGGGSGGGSRGGGGSRYFLSDGGTGLGAHNKGRSATAASSGQDILDRALAGTARCLHYDKRSRCLAIGYGDGTVQVVDMSSKRVCRRICVSTGGLSGGAEGEARASASRPSAVVQVFVLSDHRLASLSANGTMRFDVIHSRNLGL